MTIKLISKEQFETLNRIQKEYPILTLQNNGYQYIKGLKEIDVKAKKEVEDILRHHITGFSNFFNFRINKEKLQLRFDYHWDEDLTDEDMIKNHNERSPFIGVGYLYLNELLNGFDK